MRVRKMPIEVDAVRWTGENLAELRAFAGSKFEALHMDDRANCDDPEASAQVLDALHSTWVLLYDGDWIIRGIQGEFYPCRPDVFDATYELVTADSTP